jgi:nicotinamidase/pyrazinamidase
MIVAFAPDSAASGGIAKHGLGVIVVDIQGDFTEVAQGSLAVAGTDRSYVEDVKDALGRLTQAGLTILATQDWHPADHISFFSNHEGKQPFETIEIDGRTQVLWPPHCVQGTEGARLLVDQDSLRATIQKGMNRQFDSYSGFQDDGGAPTEMDATLKRFGVERVVVFGIATDFCVQATAIDAAEAGYEVVVIESLCRGVDPESSRRAIASMKEAGIVIMDSLAVDAIIGG